MHPSTFAFSLYLPFSLYPLPLPSILFFILTCTTHAFSFSLILGLYTQWSSVGYWLLRFLNSPSTLLCFCIYIFYLLSLFILHICKCCCVVHWKIMIRPPSVQLMYAILPVIFRRFVLKMWFIVLNDWISVGENKWSENNFLF